MPAQPQCMSVVRYFMRQSLTFILLLSSQTLLSQYKVDSTIKKEYFKILRKLPQEFKNEIATEYMGGLGLLYQEKTDTLNKKDVEQDFKSIKIYDIDPTTGEADTTKATLTEQEQISKNQPFPLSCSCSIKNDTLTIISGIYLFSGFTIVTKLYQGNVKAFYSEIESEDRVLQRTLKEEKANKITIPAKVNFLTLDRVPRSNIHELFGQISIITNGYYSYINVYGFKSDYIYKRMKFQYFFRCGTKSSVQQ